jgi:hypothetical protein
MRFGAAAGAGADQGLQVQALVDHASDLTHTTLGIKLAVEGQPLGRVGIPGGRGKERQRPRARNARDIEPAVDSQPFGRLDVPGGRGKKRGHAS